MRLPYACLMCKHNPLFDSTKARTRKIDELKTDHLNPNVRVYVSLLIIDNYNCTHNHRRSAHSELGGLAPQFFL